MAATRRSKQKFLDNFEEPSIKWKDSKAKRLLEKDLKDKIIPSKAKDKHNKSTMPLQEIYLLRPEFQQYHYRKFSARLGALRNAQAKQELENKEPAEPRTKWKKSKAAQMLYQDILVGDVSVKANMEKEDIDNIYNMRTEYKEYKRCKFAERLESLRKTIFERNNRKREDEEAFENYLAHNEVSKVTKRGRIQYQGSLAQKLLLADMEAELDKFMGAKALWQSREEYKEFELKAFRDYMAQERRTKRYLVACKEDGKFKY